MDASSPISITTADESSLRYEGWRIVAVCFLVATFGWAFGFYGQSVYLAEMHRAHGWPASLISGATTFFYLFGALLVVFVAGFLLVYRIINSPFGEVLKAIRENEPRTISLGYKTERYKLVAFVLSATLAGLAGAMNSLVFQLASLTDVHWTMSGDVLLMTLLGGLGTVFGPVVGAFIVIAMQNYLAPFGQWVLVIQGVIFVICVLLFRRGVVGELARLARVQL